MGIRGGGTYFGTPHAHTLGSSRVDLPRNGRDQCAFILLGQADELLPAGAAHNDVLAGRQVHNLAVFRWYITSQYFDTSTARQLVNGYFPVKGPDKEPALVGTKRNASHLALEPTQVGSVARQSVRYSNKDGFG